MKSTTLPWTSGYFLRRRASRCLLRRSASHRSYRWHGFTFTSGAFGDASSRRDEGRAKRWLAFLNNHREVIAAFDFFTVPSLTFRILYCFIVIEHGRRRILHFNVTEHPASDWIVQQLREALPLLCPYRYVLVDRDTKFGGAVVEFLQASSMKPIRSSVRSPWQRWVGSVRREVLDHVIPLNDQHLRRLGREYIAYYQEDRTHIGLENEDAGEPTG